MENHIERSLSCTQMEDRVIVFHNEASFDDDMFNAFVPRWPLGP